MQGIAAGWNPSSVHTFMELGHISAQLALLVDCALKATSLDGSSNLASVTPASESRLMPTIALVDDDRNILTSVSIALEAEAIGS